MRGTIIAREGKKILPNGKHAITYQVVVDTGLDSKGKRQQKWKTFKTKKEAENYLFDTGNKVNTGTYVTGHPKPATRGRFKTRHFGQVI